MKKSILAFTFAILALLMSCNSVSTTSQKEVPYEAQKIDLEIAENKADLIPTVSTTSDEVLSYETQEIELEIMGNRGVNIPSVITLPIGDETFPLVVMAHGHGGSKEENGGFTSIANALGEKGIAVIRMDFPGCGESHESFEANTIKNMVDDIEICKDYVINNYSVASNYIGLFGYSMGGRVVQTILDWNYMEDVKGVVLLAPAVDTNTMVNFLGGNEAWDTLKESASVNGSVEFTTMYGAKQKLSIDWFNQLEIETPIDDIKPFDGISTVLYSEDDTVVTPLVSKREAFILGSQLVEVTGDSHSYGFYSNRTDIKQAIVDATVTTFTEAFSN